MDSLIAPFIDSLLKNAEKFKGLDSCTIAWVLVLAMGFYIRYMQKRIEKRENTLADQQMKDAETRIMTANALTHLADLIQNHLIAGGK